MSKITKALFLTVTAATAAVAAKFYLDNNKKACPSCENCDCAGSDEKTSASCEEECSTKTVSDDAFTETAEEIVQKMDEVFEDMADAAETCAKQAADSGAAKEVQHYLSDIKGLLQKAKDKVNDAVDFSTVKETLKSAKDGLASAVDTEVVKSYVQSAKDTVAPYAKGAVETVKPYVESAVDTVKPYAEEAKEKLGELKEAAETKLKAAKEETKKAVSDIKEEMTEKAEEWKEDAAEPKDNDVIDDDGEYTGL